MNEAKIMYKILVIDDEPDVIWSLKKMLQSRGYQVITAENGIDGLEKASEEKPDLIFDHDLMVKHAHEKLKLRASYSLIGEKLLPERFTILQLRTLYEAIFQRQFDPGNFRKKILSLKVMEKLDDKNTTDSKKGAFYYRFKKYSEEFIQERIVKQ